MLLGKGMAVGCMGALALAVAASAGAQQRTVVGTLPDGTKVESILLRDGSGAY
jgi:aldose 1-epimerase